VKGIWTGVLLTMPFWTLIGFMVWLVTH